MLRRRAGVAKRDEGERSTADEGERSPADDRGNDDAQPTETQDRNDPEDSPGSSRLFYASIMVIMGLGVLSFAASVLNLMVQYPLLPADAMLLRDVLDAYERNGIELWWMENMGADAEATEIRSKLAFGAYVKNDLDVARASALLLAQGYEVVDTNAGLDVCSPAEGRNLGCSLDHGLISIHFYYLRGSNLVCPCCECVRAKPGGCAKRTCSCKDCHGESKSFLPAHYFILDPFKIPLQRNFSMTRYDEVRSIVETLLTK